MWGIDDELHGFLELWSCLLRHWKEMQDHWGLVSNAYESARLLRDKQESPVCNAGIPCNILLETVLHRVAPSICHIYLSIIHHGFLFILFISANYGCFWNLVPPSYFWLSLRMKSEFCQKCKHVIKAHTGISFQTHTRELPFVHILNKSCAQIQYQEPSIQKSQAWVHAASLCSWFAFMHL